MPTTAKTIIAAANSDSADAATRAALVPRLDVSVGSLDRRRYAAHQSLAATAAFICASHAVFRDKV
jgi:hypothetical protein